MQEIIQFIKSPYFISKDEKAISLAGIAKYFSLAIILYLFFTFLIAGALGVLDRSISDALHFSILQESTSANLELAKRFGVYSFFVIIVLGPFIEEIIFRLPLDLRKTSIAFSIFLVTYRITGNRFTFFEWDSVYAYAGLLLAVLVALAVIRFLPLTLLEEIRSKYYKHFFYLMALLFAMGHIGNFKALHWEVIYLYPLFVLPQFVMGFFCGWLRLKLGFLYGVVFHGLINAIGYSSIY